MLHVWVSLKNTRMTLELRTIQYEYVFVSHMFRHFTLEKSLSAHSQFSLNCFVQHSCLRHGSMALLVAAAPQSRWGALGRWARAEVHRHDPLHVRVQHKESNDEDACLLGRQSPSLRKVTPSIFLFFLHFSCLCFVLFSPILATRVEALSLSSFHWSLPAVPEFQLYLKKGVRTSRVRTRGNQTTS